MAGRDRPGGLRTRLFAHLEMMRPYTMFHSGMVALAGAQLASEGRVRPWRAALATLVTVCGWEAGLYAGDYYDRELDARSKPYRAIPSGRVSAREAFLTMVGLIGAGYAAALALGRRNLALAIGTTVLGISYSRSFKDRAFLGNFDRGVLGGCAALFGAMAGGRVLRPNVLLFCGLVLLHDSATNLVGAIRDVEGDRASGYRTVPVVYGVPRSVDVVIALVVGWMALALALARSLRPNPASRALLAASLSLALRVYADLLIHRSCVTRPRAIAAHKYLVAERLVLTSSLVAAYRVRAALWLLGASLAATLLSQALLRDRYEHKHTPLVEG